MIRRITLALLCAAALWAAMPAEQTQAQQAFNRQWAHSYNTQDWERFYHYPYVYYPQNFWSADYYRSSESLYYRYPPEMRIPVYNRQWQNEYPQNRRYHYGSHFILDTF
ncbi:MAG TPA: calmodulin-binding protein [Pirellulales bacterium]|nr:calmodulin-binding protein [Pirellulales bacterium]